MAKETGKGPQDPQGGDQSKDGGGPFHTLYATAIHGCIAGGDLQRMKSLLAEAETYLQEHGDVRAAVESLRVEIAKKEHK